MSNYFPNVGSPMLSDDEARRLYAAEAGSGSALGRESHFSEYHSDQQPWTQAGYSLHNAAAAHEAPSQIFAGQSQYVSWPAATFAQLEPTHTSPTNIPHATPFIPMSAYPGPEAWSNAPWPALHPDDREASSDTSRSTSPNPSDLRNFGILLSDGKSWRCAYKGCSSQATFTRGCDLRKHYRRHTKSLFCRYEDCPQSREGGFSSNKDRQRHEQRHAPTVRCTVKSCERVFSRVDNMRDHVRRIHNRER